MISITRTDILSFSIPFFIFLVFIDILLIFFVRHRKPLLTNKYFVFHKRYGFIKITILKAIFTLFLLYLMKEPAPNAIRTILTVILFFSIIIIKLLKDFVKSD